MSFASSIPVTLAPKQRTFALLCFLVILAEKLSLQRPARIPFTLLQAIEIPIPVPQIAIPKEFLFSKTFLQTACPKSG